jgi:hypothetical protein
MTPQEVLTQAAQIKLQIRNLEEEYKNLEQEIIRAVSELNPEGKKVDVGDLGRFSVSLRKVWEYSDKVITLAADLKQLKAEEEATGVASYTEIPSIKFTTKQNDE